MIHMDICIHILKKTKQTRENKNILSSLYKSWFNVSVVAWVFDHEAAVWGVSTAGTGVVEFTAVSGFDEVSATVFGVALEGNDGACAGVVEVASLM